MNNLHALIIFLHTCITNVFIGLQNELIYVKLDEIKFYTHYFFVVI